MEIGDKIRKARRNVGLTQRGLASIVGVSPGAVAQWEGGGSKVRNPSVEHLKKTAEVLQMSVDQILEDAPTEAAQLLVKDPEAIAMVRMFMSFSKKKRKMFLNLFYMSAGLEQPLEDDGGQTDNP